MGWWVRMPGCGRNRRRRGGVRMCRGMGPEGAVASGGGAGGSVRVGIAVVRRGRLVGGDTLNSGIRSLFRQQESDFWDAER